MLDKKIAKQSVSYAAGAIIYIAIVVTFMSNIERLFDGQNETIFAPMSMLLLLVTSAATMGMLVFGKPVMLYIDGKKREGVTMAIYTISTLAICTILLFASIIIF